ncbi:hypothetical protein Ancab_007017 [Ancistrocladus abbreviatus]
MATSVSMPKTTCHARSISLPSRPHPLDASIEDQLSRLRSSENGAFTSASSICHNLSGIKDLYEHMNDLIRLPLNQQALSHQPNHDEAEEVLDGSLCLLDPYRSTMDILSQMKESVLELQSSLRRRSAKESAPVNYTTSIKKINKMVSQCFGNLKKLKKSSTLDQFQTNSSILSVVGMLKEVGAVSISTLKSVLTYVSEQDANKVDMIDHALYALGTDMKFGQDLLRQLETLRLAITEIEDDLEAVSRCLLIFKLQIVNYDSFDSLDSKNPRHISAYACLEKLCSFALHKPCVRMP